MLRLVKGNSKKASGYPDVVTRLPEAKIAVKDARAWIHQSDQSQLVFFQFVAGTDVPSHNHLYPQWGLVIEGEMEMTIADKPHHFRKGDEYLIPAGAEHSAKFLTDTRVMDFFSEKNRYRPKRPA